MQKRKRVGCLCDRRLPAQDDLDRVRFKLAVDKRELFRQFDLQKPSARISRHRLQKARQALALQHHVVTHQRVCTRAIVGENSIANFLMLLQ